MTRSLVPIARLAPLAALGLAFAAAAGGIATTARAGGHSVGNGGDAVVCKAATTNAFNGTYALDYLLTYSDSSQPLVAVASLDASLARIRAQLATKLPELLESFDSFRGALRNTTDQTKSRLWEEAPFGLVDLKDEVIVSSLPDNCRDGDTAHIVQAVVREWPEISGRPPDHIVYRYVPAVFDQLQAQAPLQLSFLLIHEWLWDLSQNVARNRRLNRFLHSSAIDMLSRDDLRAQIAAMGFFLPGQSPDGFRDDFCTPEAGAGAYWDDRAAANFGGMLLGSYKLASRQRSCDSITGCINWQDVSGPLNAATGPQHMLTIIGPGEFRIDSYDDSAGYARHALCRYDADGHVTCSPFQTPAGPFRFAPHTATGSDDTLDFAGVLGRGCIKLQDLFWYTGESINPAGRGTFRQEQSALLFGVLGVTRS